MKKILLSLIALTAINFAYAQVIVTYQVDVTKLLATHTIAGNGMRVGGTFGTEQGTANGFSMIDWAPTDTSGRMTNLGGNLWSITVTFPSASVGDTLQFKFVDGNWGPIGTNEADGPDDTIVTEGCANSGGNRVFAVPSTDETLQWCYDHCTRCDGSSPLASTGINAINNVAVFSLSPNPAVNELSTLVYTVNAASQVNVSLYNELGQVVKVYVNTLRPAGTYNQPIDLAGLSRGTYFIRVNTESNSIASKITL